MEDEKTLLEKLNNWVKNSVMLKLITITFLMLLLLIPTEMIKHIISERETLSDQATREVNALWAGSQVVTGPVLTIPVLTETEDENGKKTQTTAYFNILPENLDITGKITPKVLKRGIYEIIVYSSDLQFTGDFFPFAEMDKNASKTYLYDKAFITIGIEDLRGIVDQVVFHWNKVPVTAEPGSRIPGIIHSGITFNLPEMDKNENGAVTFNVALNLQGSKNLSFVPLGKITKADINSKWPSPSFNGNFLPDNRDVTDQGFSATWKILELNRNYPQSWLGDRYGDDIADSAFGMDLILPVDNYQKSMRSAKYAVMCIALTFLIFFLVEILNKRRIHPFQYALVGLAVSLFYVLLVSISEQSGFNLAYLISSLAIIGMITLYSLSIFKSARFTAMLGIVMAGLYGFLFVILQLADYALLIGSIGLTLILGATMFFTRNIDWYSLNRNED